MTLFLQAAAAALLAVVLGLCLEKQGKDISVLLTMAVCVMVLAGAAAYLEPVMTFLEELQTLGELDGGLVGTLFKIVGIGLVAEIAAMVCADGGRASLGKALQILASAVILWLSIPVFNVLLELIQSILGEI